MAMRDLIPWASPSDRWQPDQFGPIAALRREMDRLFEDVFRGPSLESFVPTASWPRIEVEEDDRQMVVRAELPGMKQEDIDLSFDNGALTIRGERKDERSGRGYSERWYGRFERRIPTPSSVEADRSTATFHEGVLTVTLPKERGAEDRRRIPINADTRH